MPFQPTEADPLIPHEHPENLHTNGKITKHRPGPLELSRSARYGILAGVWSATFLSSLNMTLVPTMLPSISSEFNKSNQASWLGTSYLLATCVFTPLYGRLCNVMGRRGANQLAILFAGLGNLACGLSGNMEMLIAARFISGIGGGGLGTTSSIVVSDLYSLRSRGLAQGVASVFNGLGQGLGGPFGGLITDWLGWRWAFLIQTPGFVLAFILTSYNLTYVTPGKGKSHKEVLKRIDYGGSATLLISVGSCLVFLSTRYNESLPWSSAAVIVPLALSIVSMFLFIIVEIFWAPEPVLAPFLLKQRIPVLVGASNFLVAMCNFSITYFYPMWFQTVMLTGASTAGLHLLPNSVSMSTGSLFAGWMMHRSGKYKTLNLIFGSFPFIGAVLISLMREDSGPIQSWLSIIPLGFGNAVVLQTMLIALLAHLPESHMAVGTGFGQLFRGVGQVGGVAISSAIFQSRLETELRKRIHTPDAEQLITKIRQSARLVEKLPPDIQRIARDSYASSLKTVFAFSAVSTLLAFIVRLPVPEKDLDSRPESAPRHLHSAPIPATPGSGQPPFSPSPSQVLGVEYPVVSSPTTDSAMESAGEGEGEDDELRDGVIDIRNRIKNSRRLSTFESTDSVMDYESDTVGGSARLTQFHFGSSSRA